MKIKMINSWETSLVKESIDFDPSLYPELNGLSDEEIKDYILDHSYEMKSTDGFYGSLDEELENQDVLREKIVNESAGIIFLNDDDGDDE